MRSARTLCSACSDSSSSFSARSSGLSCVRGAASVRSRLSNSSSSSSWWSSWSVAAACRGSCPDFDAGNRRLCCCSTYSANSLRACGVKTPDVSQNCLQAPRNDELDIQKRVNKVCTHRLPFALLIRKRLYCFCGHGCLLGCDFTMRCHYAFSRWVFAESSVGVLNVMWCEAVRERKRCKVKSFSHVRSGLKRKIEEVRCRMKQGRCDWFLPRQSHTFLGATLMAGAWRAPGKLPTLTRALSHSPPRVG